jgi:predicted methyltransferase
MNRALRTIRLCAAVAAISIAPLAAQGVAGRGEAARDEWQKVDEVFAAMGVKPGAAVADIGAGGGFFTTRLAKAVGETGRVYAVDVDPKQVRSLRERMTQEQLTNVEVVEGAYDDPRLPPGSLDAALIVNAYHEMKEHQAMLAKIKAALKPAGRLVIIEPIATSRRGAERDAQTRTHEIAAEYVQQDARDAGFRVVKLEDPFTSRKTAHDEMWLMVLVPATPGAASGAGMAAGNANEDAWAASKTGWEAPELRIGVEEFKRLQKTGKVLVLDVRDEESFQSGHLPDAELMTVEQMTSGGIERLRREPRPIVTYCS